MAPSRRRDRIDGLSRRGLFRAALAIGGTSSLTACLAGGQTLDLPDLPQGEPNPETLPNRQHAWAEFLLDDDHGNPQFPEVQTFTFLDYVGSVPPTDEERRRVETAFRNVERALPWGARNSPEYEFFYPGVLFTISYSPNYLERVEGGVPDGLALQRPESILSEVGEDPEKADPHDAVLHVAADYPSVLLGVEAALFGELDELNAIPLGDGFDGIFERVERRPGFVGRGLPSEKLDVDAIPESAVASMGFKSALLDNLPPEEKVTIQSGPFSGGTIQHVSQLEIDLDAWYDRSKDDRIHRMFSPEHTVEDVGETGQMLVTDSGVTDDIADATSEDARNGVVGHSQKLARVRDEDSDPLILRRGDFNAAHPDGAVLNFGSVHRTTEDLVTTLRAMKDVGFEEPDSPDMRERDDGILHFIETVSRANFVQPTREHRALPSPDST